MRKRRVRQFDFLTEFSSEWFFFIAGTLQKNMFFVIPIPFLTYTKHFRRFLNSFWSSAEQRWFRENQRWTALKQRWSALKFIKSLKQRCSVLICSGTSTQEVFGSFDWFDMWLINAKWVAKINKWELVCSVFCSVCKHLTALMTIHCPYLFTVQGDWLKTWPASTNY